MGTQIDLIVGLGNPGPEYATTRHNAGFWFADLLAKENGGRFTSTRKLQGDSAEIKIAGHRIRLLKPMTYMNSSGQSVSATINYYKIPAEHVSQIRVLRGPAAAFAQGSPNGAIFVETRFGPDDAR